MNIFDIVIIILLLFGFVRGLMKGFFVEVASLLALILYLSVVALIKLTKPPNSLKL